jgi:hypothetical protein
LEFSPAVKSPSKSILSNKAPSAKLISSDNVPFKDPAPPTKSPLPIMLFNNDNSAPCAIAKFPVIAEFSSAAFLKLTVPAEIVKFPLKLEAAPFKIKMPVPNLLNCPSASASVRMPLTKFTLPSNIIVPAFEMSAVPAAPSAK